MSTLYDRSRVERVEVKSLTPEEAQAFRACMQEEGYTTAALTHMVLSGVTGYALTALSPFKAYAKYVALGTCAFGFLAAKVAYSAYCLQKSVPRIRHYIESQQRLRNQQELDPSVSLYRDTSNEPISSKDFGDPITSYDSYLNTNDSSVSSNNTEVDLTEPTNIQQNVSYNDLRQKHREEYRKKIEKYNSRPTKPPVEKQKDSDFDMFEERNAPPKKTNAYGDVWD